MLPEAKPAGFFMHISKFKFHCSHISSLMANSRDNRPLTELQWDKFYTHMNRENFTDAQICEIKQLVLKQSNYNPKTLIKTTKQELIKIYSWNKYKKGSVGATESLSLEKGTIAEWESISLLSQVDGIKYKKNKKLYTNEYLKGYPDIVVKKPYIKVIDVKSSFDLNSFLFNQDGGLPAEYEFQMLGYLDITKADYGEVCFCLVNTPAEIIAQQIRSTKQKYFLYGKSDEALENRIKFINDSMIFDDIPAKRKVIRYRVNPNPDKMKEIYERVIIAREWLQSFHKKHIFGKK